MRALIAILAILAIVAAAASVSCAVLAQTADPRVNEPAGILHVVLAADGKVVVHGQEMSDADLSQNILRRLRHEDPGPRVVIQAERNALGDRITTLVDAVHDAGLFDVYLLGADQESQGLEFRIAATPSNMAVLYNEMTGRRISPEHSRAIVDQARHLLDTEGPSSVQGRSDAFWWFPVRAGTYDQDMILEVRDAKTYALLANRDPDALRHVPGRAHWHVQRVSQVQDTFHHAAIEFELDDAGGRLQTDLTATHQGQPLAILVDDTVLAAPIIKKPVGARGMITGGSKGWDQKAAAGVVKTLSDEAVGIAASQPAASQPATKPTTQPKK